MFSRFFIDRPIFASVLSIFITLAGAIAIGRLPLAQYPPITPPTIQVQCTYPGASAQVVAETVAAPLEQQINGVEKMLYMSSQSTNDGAYNLTVTFEPDINLNFAQVLVQNRVNLALPNMPDVVKQTGITTRKRSPDILLFISLMSSDGRYDQLFLSNYALINVREPVARLEGVGDVFIFGQQDYSMRIWVDPQRLAMMNLSAGDVVKALADQNAQVAGGMIGQEPISDSQQLQLTMATLGRLSTPQQFENVVVNADSSSRLVRIKDIGRVDLGAKNMDVQNRLDGKPCTSIAVFQLPDANALDTAERIQDKMKDLARDFPEGLKYEIAYDTTPFIRESIQEVFNTLRAAIILVALVVLVFLQNWRSAVIPLIAVPVAIVGTFAVMRMIGFSMNNLTLFGLVLAIGIVVDDAIVVVEAVEHHIEEGMAPRAATLRAMQEVSGPVVAVALVLSAVFVPCAFISGIVGQFFRQFALTIAVSTILSAFNSLTLSPALAALLLKPKGAKKDWLTRGFDLVLGWFFRLFNAVFRLGTGLYVRSVGLMLRGQLAVVAVYVCLLGLTWWYMQQLPTGYIPAQDKGYLLVSVQLPDAASLERTRAVTMKIERIAAETDGVAHTIAVDGQSFVLAANGSNFGNVFVPLKPFHERRHDPSLYSDVIIAKLKARFAREIPEAITAVFGPPAVNGLGTAGGFKFIVEDQSGNLEPRDLQDRTDAIVNAARQDPRLAGLFTVFRANAPQLYVDVNRKQCAALGVQIADLFNTLQIYLGSLYVNDFNLFGRTWQVIVQADANYRDQIEDFKQLKVRNASGGMVPLGAVADVRLINGPLILARYNMRMASAISGNLAPGVSTGDGITIMQGLADQELPRGRMGYEWTEITFLQIRSGNTAMVLFLLAVVLVFLVLAAQYESWALPLAVILVVPMCLLGSIAGVDNYNTIVHFVADRLSAIGLHWQPPPDANSDINIFTQIGFVVLVGLASKNAILIVEFAKNRREEGQSIRDATLAACRLRLRPILMTSFAFILGVVPLMIATGAGAEMRKALGVAVFFGMLGVTLFGIFLTPVFFHLIDQLAEASEFDSPLAREISYWMWILSGVLTLGLFWGLSYLFRAMRRDRALTPDAELALHDFPPVDAPPAPNWPVDGNLDVQRPLDDLRPPTPEDRPE